MTYLPEGSSVLFGGGLPNAIGRGLFFRTIQFVQRTLTLKPHCLIDGGGSGNTANCQGRG